MPRRSETRLSDRAIRCLPLPEKGSQVIYDADIAGFGIRLTATGARAFVLNYLVDRRERRLTIGRFPTWSTSAARERARALKRQIDLGVDPLAENAERLARIMENRDAPTVRTLFERYEQEHLPTKAARSAADDRSMWQAYILPALGPLPVAELTPSDVDALHAGISKTKPVRANRVIEVLRKALNLAIRWGWRPDNPASGVRKNREEHRTMYLSQAEILRLGRALDGHPERTSAAAIKLMMLTGARKSEVLSARWDHVDLERGVWVKPSAHTKQRREHRVPLSAPAVALLRDLATERTSPFVFASGDVDRPLTDVKRTWLAVCREAGLAVLAPRRTRNGAVVVDAAGDTERAWQPRVRLHDLRHTYASVLASEGLSLPIIGALLGHTQAQTTARYAHLFDDPLREATERVARTVSGSH